MVLIRLGLIRSGKRSDKSFAGQDIQGAVQTPPDFDLATGQSTHPFDLRQLQGLVVKMDDVILAHLALVSQGKDAIQVGSDNRNEGRPSLGRLSRRRRYLPRFFAFLTRPAPWSRALVQL